MSPEQVIEMLRYALLIGFFGTFLMWWITREPEGCKECEHCRRAKFDKERQAIERRKTEAHQMAHSRYGVRYCPYCTDGEEDR